MCVEDADVSVSVSYMEIYKEEVYDLLVDRDSVSPCKDGPNDQCL